MYFFFNDTATTEIYTLSLHDALPILSMTVAARSFSSRSAICFSSIACSFLASSYSDRKSTRLNSSHANISYAVFCLKKNKKLKSLQNLDYYTSQHHTNDYEAYKTSHS